MAAVIHRIQRGVTKRKALEAAVKCYCVGRCHRWCSGRVTPGIAASRAYDYGREAGIKESLKEFEPYDDPEGGCCDSAICEYFESHSRELRSRADRLEKKARAK